MAASSGLEELYRRQEQAAVRPPPPAALKVAFGLLLPAALVGPMGFATACGGICMVMVGPSQTIFIAVNPLLAILSVVVIAVGVHGLRDDSVEELALAGLLGLLFYPMFFVGTVLSAFALLVLWLGHRKRSPRRAPG